MQFNNFIRLGGLAAVVCGASWTIAERLYLVVGMGFDVERLATPTAIFQGLLFLLGALALVGALVALYADRAGSLGSLGTAGFLVAFVGTVLVAGANWDGAFTTPSLAQRAPQLLEAAPPAVYLFGQALSYGLFALGWLLLGIAAFRSGAYPRVASVLVALGALVNFVPAPFTAIVFGVGVAWMGLSLLSGKTGATQAAPRVS
jgi:hypothetical protein